MYLKKTFPQKRSYSQLFVEKNIDHGYDPIIIYAIYLSIDPMTRFIKLFRASF